MIFSSKKKCVRRKRNKKKEKEDPNVVNLYKRRKKIRLVKRKIFL